MLSAVPLSHGQRALWLLHRLAPGSSAYVLAGALRVRGPLDVPALRQAFEILADRHPALRVSFREGEGTGSQPLQQLFARRPPLFTEEDASGWDEATLDARQAEFAWSPFDLERDPLLRVGVLHCGPDEHRIVVALHHIVADFWSLGVLLKELSVLYRERGGPGMSQALRPLRSTYAEHVHRQRSRLEGPEGERLWEFWRRELHSRRLVLDLPTDRPRPLQQTFRGDARSARLAAERTDRLRGFARGQRTTLFTVLLTAFQALLHRYTGEEEILVGSPTAGRGSAKAAGLVGYFVNPVVFRGDLAGDPDFTVLLDRGRQAVLAALAHRGFPFPLLAERLASDRDPSRSPVFQVMLAFEQERGEHQRGLAALAVGEAGVPVEIGGLAAETLRLPPGGAQVDLTLFAAVVEGRLVTSLHFNPDLFDGTTADRMLGHLEGLLGEVVHDPARRLSELPLLTEPERQELSAWNATAVRWAAAESCLHELILSQVERTPDSAAVVFESATLSYGELASRSRRLAGRLCRMGVGAEVPVGICAERSLDLVVGLLAILTAGGAYLPLDPSYPQERLARMLEDALPQVVLVTARTADLLPAHPGRRVALDSGPLGEEGDLAVAIRDGAGPESLAYVIFTSGSTGRPKGAMNSHRAIVNRLLWARENQGITSSDRVLQKTPVSFDVSVWELFLPLLSGACLVLAQPGGHRDAAYLARTFAEREITVAHFVPAILQAFLAEPGIEQAMALRQVVASGEALSAALQGRFFDRLPRVELLNLYGPTEAAVDVTCWRCAPGSAVVPIGRPVANTAIRLLDRSGQEVPVGIPGELHIGGAQLARGYLGRPDLTAERFVPDASGEPGSRLYRTGDLARRLPGGEIDYLGRLDSQIKIRGVRIELGEIEAALAAHPTVREAVVVAREEGGEKRLAAYLVAAAGGSPASEELRVFLRRSLPESMIPAAFVTLDTFPLTPSGKVDRRRLPAPEGIALAGRHVAPRTPAEVLLCGIWSEVLGREQVGVEDDFFSLGGHSLLAGQVLSRVRETFGVELPLPRIFEWPTVAGLAALLAAAGPEERGAPPMVRDALGVEPVLSCGQERLWFLDQLDPGKATYNMPAAVALRGSLDFGALAASLGEIVRRHEVLRTRFVETSGRPEPVLEEPAGAALPVVDLSSLPEPPRESLAQQLAGEEARRPFDLSRGPVIRAILLRLSREEHRLLFTLHHIACDGWSLEVLMRELSGLYGAFVERRPSPLPELPLQYSDYALWQRRWLSGGVLEEQLSYWRERLAGAPRQLALPTDRPRPAVRSGRGGALAVAVPADLHVALEDLAGARRATLFMALLAGWSALLSRYTGQRDLLVGSPVANRTRVETEGLIGFFLNTLVLRIEIAARASFGELLERVRDVALEAYAHQDLPFEKLVEALESERSAGFPPLIQTLLALDSRPRGEATLPVLSGLTCEILRPETRTAKFDLSCDLRESGGELLGRLEYSQDLFDGATVERLLRHFSTLLEAAVRQPEVDLSELPLITVAEREQLLLAGIGPPSAYPGLSLGALFGEVAGRRPDAVALVSVAGDAALTYEELDRRSSWLAQTLRREGVGLETPVGICLARSSAMVVAVLAVVKSGGAYLPLDPEHPAERLAFQIADSGVEVVLTEERWLGMLPGAVRSLCLDREGYGRPAEPATAPARKVQAENLACVLYTSGSTGQPKRVGILHGGVARLVLGVDYVTFGPEEVLLQLAPLAFDASTVEIWGALLHGSRLVLFPAGTPSPEQLGSTIERHGVSLLWLTAGLFHSMVVDQLSVLGSVRQLLAGGDVLSPAHVARVVRELPGVRLSNCYGPTEATTFTTCHAVEVAPAPGDMVPIGRPIASTQVYVLDGGIEPVPQGIAGELCVGGEGLARGYLGRPDLTAERFVPSPAGHGERLYRTGDSVRLRGDGTLQFLGRLDNQVKIRGFRVEPGESEAWLARHPDVAEAAVVAREDGASERRLVAYVVPREGTSPRIEDLRSYLRSHLIEAQIPSAWVFLASLPLTANAKVDRRRLPAPEWGASSSPYVAPRGPLEERIATIWGETLGREPVGVEDDFFLLGGHSLLATQLLSRLRSSLGVELSLRQLFERPTVAALAALVEAARPAERQLPPLGRAEMRTGVLSFSQERLWFLDQLEPGKATYNMPMAAALRGTLDAGALAASLGEIVRRHEVLRTRFELSAGRPWPVVEEPASAALPVVDLRALSGERRERLALALAGEEARRPFDLSRGPVVRAVLLRLAAEEHRLLFTLHHIAGDGWSLGVLIAELRALYGACLERRPSPLPELTLQYSDYALWQRRWLSGEVLAGELAYWRQRLAGAPALLELPVDRQRPVVRSGRAGQLPFQLAPAAVAGLRGWAARRRATLFMTALTAFAALLSRATGGEDLPIGAPIAGRTHREVEGLIGFFINTLVLRVDASGDPSFGELLDRVRATTLEAYAHPHLPFERLVEELAPERSLAHSPLFQVTVNFLNTPLGPLTLPGLELEPVAVDSDEGSKFDLAFILEPGPVDIRGTLLYSRDLFDRSTLRRLLDQLERLLVASVALPERGITDLPLLGDAERHQLLVEWNDTAEPVADRDACLHALFVRQSERIPDAVALVCDEEWLSFGELARRSGRLAGRLRALGVGPESRVAICAERSLAMIVGLLGILRAGGAYVALDPSHPRERLAQLLAEVQSDAAEPVLLVQAHLAERLPERPGHRLILEDQASLQGESAPADLAVPANAAYMIFTSGSTGRPKVVVVEHRQMVQYLQGIATSMGITGERSFALVQLITVDASKTLIFPPLARGGTLHLITKERALTPGALAAYLRRHGIHGTKIAPSHLSALQAVSATADLVPEGWLIFGGEASRPEWALDLAAARPGSRVFNHYGPTETTVGVTACEIRPGLTVGPSRTTHLGRPVKNARIYLLDRHGRPVPPGISGEIHAGGPFVTRGYHGRPELTAERYVPDALGCEPGARLYRTGDLARLFADGQIEFLGRVDDQVKIRGFRIELGEIAVELGRHPQVRSAVVMAPSGPGGARRLVAYVVPRESRPSPAELRRFLGERLPEYMVPQAFAFLAALPRSAHGKVDRQALAAVPLEVETGAESYLAPRNPVEELLAGIWSEVLKLDRVGSEDDFFTLGGHSLLAVQVVSRIREAFGVELPLRQIFEYPTLAGLAAAVAAEQPAASGVPPLLPQERPREIPLSFAQERLWFLDQLDPGSAAYNMPFPVRLEGALEPRVLGAVLGEVVRRHEVLRTTFPSTAGRPWQAIAPPGGFALPVVDLAALPGEAREGATARLAAADAARPFDLARGPLLRAALLRRAPAEHVLLLSLHHIASDGWSTGVLIREVAALYPALAGGGPSPLPELAVQYADFAIWQRGWLSGEALAAELSYWRERLAGAPEVLDLPLDRPRPLVSDGRAGRLLQRLPAPLSRALQQLGRRELGLEATLFMVLLAAWSAFLSRISGQEEVVVGAPVANRRHREIEGLVGFFVNTLALRTDLRGDPGFAELLGRVRQANLADYAHQDLPFERLVGEMAAQRSLSHSPLFQVLFVLQNASAESLELPGLVLAPLPVAAPAVKFDLSLEIVETPSGLAGVWDYRAGLLEETTVARFAGHFEALLGDLVARPMARLSELSLLSGPERQQLLEWNAGAAGDPGGRPCLQEWIAVRAEGHPDAAAVVFEDAVLSYGELLSRTAFLTGHLRRLGVGPEVRVGVCLERSLDLMVGLLAILAVGGAYVPLDPSYPRERLAWMLEDALPAVTLVEERTAPLLPAYPGRRVVLRAGVPLGVDGSFSPLPEIAESGTEAENLAYVIFTSGSTGRPKGAMNSHRAIINRLLWAEANHRMTAADRVLQKTPVSFDVSVWELFLPLLSGACLVMALPGGHQDPAYLARTLAEREITVAHFVPAMLQAFLAEPGIERATALRLVAASGEALPAALLERFFSRLPGVALVNLYGPTEAAVDVTFWPAVPGAATVPIGRPVAATYIRLLDRRGQPVPVGVAGELHIGGVQVARGYLGRPDLTAERFVPDTLGEPGSRLYRTGDLARHLRDGEIEYLGRIDTQVKLRGFRIELGEIEAVLDAHPEVHQAALLLREDVPGERRLVAYIVPRGEPGLEAGELRSYLRARLPEHMIPAAFVSLAALPVTANGKLDRRALPPPAAEQRVPGAAHAVPESVAQRCIAAIWQEVLGVDKVGLDDNFFDLGGHSLLVARVHGRLKEEVDPAPSMVDLFRFPTVRTLAEHLKPRVAAGSAPARDASRERAEMRVGAYAAAPPPVAIVGMAGRFPGAENPRELWRNLCAGVESIRFFSLEELREAGVPPRLLAHPDYVRARGYLPGVELFDAAFFGYTPREAEIIDPQQRIFLECAWEALEDAGYDPGSYPGAIGLYAGSGMSTYLVNLFSHPELIAAVGDLQVQLGNDKDYLVTRVSYKLNLRGPSIAVQTACSTSLVAVHLACESLRHGECDMALAGGVTIATSKAGYLYQEGSIHSPDGHCRAFDASGRGTVGGSGAGIVVLKRLDRALADGDSIYAVIRGSAINNDGSAKVGFTAPSVAGQAAVIAEAQAVAGVDPASIRYVEAHGTGTTLGDPIEVAALSQVLSGSGKRGFCALGSIKTNLGHMDTAAGVAGLIKTALALRHGQIPPSLNFTVPNPQIDFANGPVYVNTELRDWPADALPRRAGVSAFGIGGTNAHAVLEEAPRAALPAAVRPAEVLVLSARSAAALETATDNLARHLESHPDLDLADVAHTLGTGRRSFDHRRMLVCRSRADAVVALRERDPERILGGVAENRERPVVFLLPGQGAQHVNMGLDLYRDEPTFREQIDRCAELLAPRLGYDLRSALYPAEVTAEAERRLRRPEVSNPALFAVETALALLWRERGITPRAMMGYSFGEYVAAYLAGVFTLEDALALIADRAAMLAKLPPGAMLAVPLPEEEVAPFLGDGLSLAAVNGPAVSVAAGPPERIAELLRELVGRGVDVRPVPMPYAAHSWMLDPLLQPFAERMARVPMRAPQIPYVSNTTGTWVRPEQATDPHEWARHLRLPVRFAAGFKTIFEEEDAVLLEVGPGRGLSTLARANGSGARPVIPSLRHPKEEKTDFEALLSAQGRLWLAGLPVGWGREGEGRRRVSLPTYPFERRRYWIDRQDLSWMAAPGGHREVEETGSRHDPAVSASAAAATGHGRPALSTVYVAPTGPLEEQLAGIWEDLLGIGGIGIHDNFYELGGHSLLATQVISRVREALGISVPLEDFFSAPTIAALAGLVAQVQVDRLEEGELAQLLSEVQNLGEEELRDLLDAEAVAPKLHES